MDGRVLTDWLKYPKGEVGESGWKSTGQLLFKKQLMGVLEQEGKVGGGKEVYLLVEHGRR